MKMYKIVFMFLLLGGVGTAQSQDRCADLLIGNTYSCEVTEETHPADSGPFDYVFAAPVPPNLGDMSLVVSNNFFSVNYTCGCAATGKPGKIKLPEKSRGFLCLGVSSGVEKMIAGKVSGSGKAIKAQSFTNTGHVSHQKLGTGVIGCTLKKP